MDSLRRGIGSLEWSALESGSGSDETDAHLNRAAFCGGWKCVRATGEDHERDLCGGVGEMEERLGECETGGCVVAGRDGVRQEDFAVRGGGGKAAAGELWEFVYAAGCESRALHDYEVGCERIGGTDLGEGLRNGKADDHVQ